MALPYFIVNVFLHLGSSSGIDVFVGWRCFFPCCKLENGYRWFWGLVQIKQIARSKALVISNVDPNTTDDDLIHAKNSVKAFGNAKIVDRCQDVVSKTQFVLIQSSTDLSNQTIPENVRSTGGEALGLLMCFLILQKLKDSKPSWFQRFDKSRVSLHKYCSGQRN